MTDMAFHKNWYQSRPSIKREFMLMILSNNLKCRIVAFESFSISLSSFMTVRLHAFAISLTCLQNYY